MGEWQPIESAPKTMTYEDDVFIDLWVVGGDWPEGRRRAECRWCHWYRDGEGGWAQKNVMRPDILEEFYQDEIATHWMPLPAPPQEPGDAG